MRPEKPENDRNSQWRQLGLFAVISSELVASVGIGALVGWWLKNRYGLGWWVAVVIILAGFALAMARIYRITRREIK